MGSAHSSGWGCMAVCLSGQKRGCACEIRLGSDAFLSMGCSGSLHGLSGNAGYPLDPVLVLASGAVCRQA